jgi:protein tyrosine/serine phosphatase
MAERVHVFEGVENFRDFGDYAASAGRLIKAGRLLRSGHHARATDADLERMESLGISVVVDLRRGAERREQPSRRARTFSAEVIESRDADMGEPPHVQFLRTTDLTESSVRGFMLDTYRAMPFDARHREVFARYFDALARVDGAVLIHCAAGKDRTGLLAALTHHLAGVSRKDLMEDYLLTNVAVRLEERAPEIGRRIQEAYGRKAGSAAVRAFLGVEPAYLEAALTEIEARAGTLDAYFEQALAVDAALRERVAMRVSR